MQQPRDDDQQHDAQPAGEQCPAASAVTGDHDPTEDRDERPHLLARGRGHLDPAGGGGDRDDHDRTDQHRGRFDVGQRPEQAERRRAEGPEQPARVRRSRRAQLPCDPPATGGGEHRDDAAPVHTERDPGHHQQRPRGTEVAVPTRRGDHDGDHRSRGEDSPRELVAEQGGQAPHALVEEVRGRRQHLAHRSSGQPSGAQPTQP